ncbi:MAG TPA: glycosyltransferase family 39 protein [Thermodesulfobacteriota bacterium]
MPWGKQDELSIYWNTVVSLIILCGLCFFLFFFRLADTGIMYPSFEPRRMLLAKDMVRNGHWLVPDLLGKPYILKPPLLPWLISAGYILFGSADLWAARFFPALAGLLTVVVTFFFAKRLFNQRVGFFAALILATNLLYIRRVRMAEEDVILTLFVTLALLTFFLAYYYQAGKRYYVFFYLFVALACLTKGPPGLSFPVLTIIPFLLLRRDLRAIRKMELFPWALIFGALVVSWYIFAYAQSGLAEARNFFVADIWNKFFPQETGRPFYQYVVQLFGHFFPWSLFLPAAAVYVAIKQGKRERECSFFLLCWIIPNLFLFSLAGAKRNEYILPLYPALAIVMAQAWERFLVDKKDSLLKKVTLLGIYAFAFLAIGAGLFGPIFSLIKYPQDLLWNGLLGLLLVLGGVTILFFAKRRQYIAFFPVAAIVMMGFIFTFTSHIAPTYLRYTTPNDFCAKVAATVGSEAELISFRCQDEFIINELDRMIPNIDQESELDNYLAEGKQVFIIMDGKEFLRLKDAKPQMHLVIFQEHFLKMKRSVALVTNRAAAETSAVSEAHIGSSRMLTARNAR